MKLSISDLDTQIAEVQSDLQAFVSARDTIRRRVVEVRDAVKPATLLPRLTEWSGTDAVLGSLDLTIHAMERTLAELKELRQAELASCQLTVIEGGYGREE